VWHIETGMEKEGEEYSREAQKRGHLNAINTAEVIYGKRKKLAFQDKFNCPACGKVYEEPISEPGSSVVSAESSGTTGARAT